MCEVSGSLLPCVKAIFGNSEHFTYFYAIFIKYTQRKGIAISYEYSS